MKTYEEAVQGAAVWQVLAGRLQEQAADASDVREKQLAEEMAAMCQDFCVRRLLDAKALHQEQAA